MVVAALIAASGCAASSADELEQAQEGNVADESAGETPYYGCWQYSTWSAWTSNDNTAECRSETATYGGRRHCVKERADHPYSVRVFNDWMTEGKAAAGSAWNVCVDCENGTLSFCTGWTTSVPDEWPGCGGSTKLQAAQIRVRAAACL